MGANASRPSTDSQHSKRLRIAGKGYVFQQRYQRAKQQAKQLGARLSFRSSRVHAVPADPLARHSLNVVPTLLSSFHWGQKIDPDIQLVADIAVQVDPSELTAGPVAANSNPSKWRKGDCIGSGSFGSVFLGLNCVTGELLAVKEVATCVKGSPHQREALEQLEQELAVLSSLSHCNIVRYYGTAREGNSLFIFLEYVPGGSIASLIHKFGPLDEPVIRTYTRQLLSGLAYLHAQRTIHRDIKCANLLVDKDGLVKLADLGMAKQLVEAVSVTKSFKGTAYWMAPEVVRQQGHGPAADIWSVGCTVLEMATGKPPWHECTSQVQVIFKIASSNEVPAVPESLSPMAASFIQLCLQRDPAVRSTAQQLLQHPFVAGTDVHVPPGMPLQLLQQQVAQAMRLDGVDDAGSADSLVLVAGRGRGGTGAASRWDQQQRLLLRQQQGARGSSPKRSRIPLSSTAASAGQGVLRGGSLTASNRHQGISFKQQGSGVQQQQFIPPGTAAIATAAAAPPGTFRQLQSRLLTVDEAGGSMGFSQQPLLPVLGSNG